MQKYEFEKLAIRNDEPISCLLFEVIERFYMSENDYHRQHGGLDETKLDFVKRVFGGKVNTPKTVLKKIIAEAIRENTWCLQGCNDIKDKEDFERMNDSIAEHYSYLARHDY